MRPAGKVIVALGSLTAWLAPFAAHAADEGLVDKLAPEIAKRCYPSGAGGATGTISASDLGRAIYASKVAPLTAEYDWNRKGGGEIARMAFARDRGDNRDALELLRRLAETWTDPASAGATSNLPLAAGGVEVLDSDGRGVPIGAAEAVLAAILNGDDHAFLFRCLPSPPANGERPAPRPRSGGEASRAPAFLITKKPGDLARVQLADRPYAEVAYLSDRDAHKDSLSFYATIGLSWPDFVFRSRDDSPATGNSTLRFAPTLFAQIERQGSGSADPKNVNNLDFGLQLAGFLQTRSPSGPGRVSQTLTHAFALNARYLTDTHFASSGWSVAAQITPDIPLPGNNVAYTVPGTPVRFRWRLTGVADHVSIEDPGHKVKLIGAPQYTRIGFDVTGVAKYFLDGAGKQAVTLGIDYSLRQRLGSGLGNARLLSARLAIEPTPNFSFGIAYDRGKNLDTLEHGDTVKLTFGVRR